MKKRIGELYGKPIVIGNENEVTINEVYYTIDTNGIVTLKARKDDGLLHSITSVPEENPVVEPGGNTDELPNSVLTD